MASMLRMFLLVALVACASAANSTNTTTPATTSVVNTACQTAFQTYWTPLASCPLGNAASFCANAQCVQSLSAFVAGIPVECQAIGTTDSAFAQVTPATFLNMQNLVQMCKSGKVPSAASTTSATMLLLGLVALAQLL
ncbi:hypothetical protein SPRG_03196 [Saprolegnia parasitica CBS 223.65]|uniref:Extracellular membrane protein CFEM domain-containing protein n=1 Tax=Saprolegnia parasitica (strain CBS 223.65) TaxID=695850 RepID=A0A067CRU0_SAPPC|nr:hypothetical protein SPRG_03196 [Saprolegnia parasitica CBS 223.65]KDO31980.1 hypothetical protein SPRG_03196 [Saprolegnia parasitica CBS 223.65]|eukprot:XP_012197176.1 hypothetical protein SPRG_03196 [Saprolegnia parasitica CBS 223.65]